MVVQGNVITIRDASLGDISHTDIHQDPHGQVAGNSFNISATNTDVLSEQHQTRQLNGKMSQEQLPAFELNRQSIKVSEGIADVMQDG